MAIPIEGYSVIALRDRIAPHLETGNLEAPNATVLDDGELWRCSFMTLADAKAFLAGLGALGLNVATGPDSDAVLVNEVDLRVEPACEWLETARWEKAVIAWKAGTTPETVTAPVGWNPEVGSGLRHDLPAAEDLEFLRRESDVEVYRDKNTDKEVYVGRGTPPTKEMFESAAEVVSQNLVSAGQPKLSGKAAEKVAKAVEMLETVLAGAPHAWNVLWFHGKGHLALGNLDAAYRSMRAAFDLERGEPNIPRELAGICMVLDRFDEAVEVAEAAAALEPDDHGLIGNVALAYLLAGRIEASQKAIAAARKLDSKDRINKALAHLIEDVAEGRREPPTSMADLKSG